MIKSNILKIKGDWNEVLNDCRFTVNKNDLDKEPSDEFKKSILIAEHSPIRNIIFKWEWIKIPTWVVNHWARHKWEKYVGTQRTDKTGKERGSQSEPANIRCEANVQHLIDTMRKRLCFKSSPETRECAESLKIEIKKTEPFISDVLVPNCIYRCGCPENNKCTFFDVFINNFPKDKCIFDIQDRYDVYNTMLKNNKITV